MQRKPWVLLLTLPLAVACSDGGSEDASSAPLGLSAGGDAPAGDTGDPNTPAPTPGSGGNDEAPIFEAPPMQDAVEGGCGTVLNVTYRDFSEAHPDFEMQFQGDVVRLNLLEPNLGADGKPVFLDSVGCPPDHDNPRVCGDWDPMQPTITSAKTFADWYHTVEGVNHEISGTLPLTELTPGSGTYVYDSTAFFPLSPTDGFGVTPAGNNLGANFLFTTEIHLSFEYVAGQVFRFRGDDDLWIYVNDRLAMDLGSMHNAEEGEIDFDLQAAELGIVPGQTYAMDIFHAERHTTASNFRVETTIGCFRPAEVR